MISRLELAKIRRYLIKVSRDDTLAGYCGIASYIITKAALARGERVTFHMNDYHCFTEVGPHFVDITAKQFNQVTFPAIYMRLKPLLDDNGWEAPVHDFNKRRVFLPGSSPDGDAPLRRMFYGWPEDQNPYRNKELIEDALSTL